MRVYLLNRGNGEDRYTQAVYTTYNAAVAELADDVRRYYKRGSWFEPADIEEVELETVHGNTAVKQIYIVRMYRDGRKPTATTADIMPACTPRYYSEGSVECVIYVIARDQIDAVKIARALRERHRERWIIK